MKNGLVIIDIVIDQGGIFEIIDKIMIYDDLIYIKYGVVYYVVVNMLGVVLCILMLVLNNVMLFYVFMLVNKGYREVFKLN